MRRVVIVVPSLFADYDPTALERRLVPMAPASSDSGLSALAPDERYTLPSDLYTGETRPTVAAMGEAR